MSAAGERYHNYEVHETSARWFVRVETSDGVWVEEDITDPEYGGANVATLTDTEEDRVIADTLTLYPGLELMDLGFASQFLWPETYTALNRVVVKHEL